MRHRWATVCVRRDDTHARHDPKMLTDRHRLHRLARLLRSRDFTIHIRLHELHLADDLADRQGGRVFPVSAFEGDKGGNEQGAVYISALNRDGTRDHAPG